MTVIFRNRINLCRDVTQDCWWTGACISDDNCYGWGGPAGQSGGGSTWNRSSWPGGDDDAADPTHERPKRLLNARRRPLRKLCFVSSDTPPDFGNSYLPRFTKWRSLLASLTLDRGGSERLKTHIRGGIKGSVAKAFRRICCLAALSVCICK